MPHKRVFDFDQALIENDSQPGGRRKRLKADEKPFRSSFQAAGKIDQQLCHQCSQFDFRAAFTGNASLQEGIFIADVGKRFRAAISPSDCSLCQMLHRCRLSRHQIDQSEESLDLDGHDQLRAYPFLAGSEIASLPWLRSRDSCGLMALMIVPSSSVSLSPTSLVYEAVKNHIQARDCAVLQQSTEKSIFSVERPTGKFDFDKAMSWIQYCDCWHKPLCLNPNSGSRRIKLLNCDTLAVEEATDDHPYVALSYVWGESSSAEDFVERNRSGRRVLLSKSPRVISDAIHATRSLGYRYLWIDKLCIDQNNANEKHQQIQQMDVIYEKAQLTIIAAAGENETYGLPGVTRKRVPRMEKVMIGSALEIVWTAKDPHYAIRESVWSTRGWTFQEAVLSRRRLVFLDDQVYFECDAMNCWESLITPLDTLHIKSRTRMEESFRAGVFDRNERMRFGDFDFRYLPVSGVFAWYLSSIEEYTARKLRFDTDSCTALAGVMRRFTKRERPIYEVWGLPYPDDQNNITGKTGYFIHSLTWFHVVDCWQDTGTPRRRPDFPSWSWAGWSGRVEYDSEKAVHTINFIRRLELKNPDSGEIRPFQDLGRTIDHGQSPYRILMIEAPVIPLSLITYNLGCGLRANLLEATSPTDGLETWKVGEYAATLHLSGGAISESLFLEDIEAGGESEWRCVLIESTHSHRTHLMILRENNSTNNWVRLGMFIVYCHWVAIFRSAGISTNETEFISIE